MSADFSANGGGFPKHHSPMTGSGLPYRGQGQGQQRVQVPGLMMQSGMNTTSPSAMLAYGLPTPAAEKTTSAWQTRDFGPALGAPVMQAPAGQYATAERSPYLRPQASEQFDQTISPSRSPNMHARTPSHLDTLSRQNAELRNEVEGLRVECDQTQQACDSMLTELITAQEALAERDAEVQSLREQLSHQGGGDHGSLSRNDERELRDLRLRCNRLQGDIRQKDEQLRQAQTQTNMHHTMHGNTNLNAPNHIQHNRELSDAQQRYMDAENRANHAQHMHQQAQQEADTYAQQLRDWSVAYDGLKASYTDLYRTQSDTSQTARSHVDEKATQQQLAASKAAVDDVKKMRDFFKDNSEKVGKKNIEATELMRKLQDELYAKTMDFEQQRSMLEQFQLQVR